MCGAINDNTTIKEIIQDRHKRTLRYDFSRLLLLFDDLFLLKLQRRLADRNYATLQISMHVL